MSGINANPEFQILISGSITGNAQTVDITSTNHGTTSLQLTGTWIGTLLVEASVDGTNYTTLTCLRMSDLAFVTSFTANDVFLVPSTSYNIYRVRSTAWTSGTVNISSYGSDSTSLNYTDTKLRGGTDGTVIGNTGSSLNVNANIDSGEIVPTITNKFRIRSNITNVTVPAAYTTLFSRSGTGLFFGFQVAFNSANIDIKLTIDGGTVFELNLNTIKQFEFNDTTASRMQLGGFLTTISNKLDFSSKFAIPYDTSVSIDVKRSDGSDHINNNWIVFLTEDT